MENKLMNAAGGELVGMSEAEFMDATESIIVACSDQLRRRLFKEALEYVHQKENQQEGVPVHRLARILHQIYVYHPFELCINLIIKVMYHSF